MLQLDFENQPVESVVKAIVGDLLHENYSIVPGVQGNISFSTSQPVTTDQALPILEQLATLGDGANDVLMFRRSGLSIAMGNASEEVRRQATCVTAANDDDCPGHREDSPDQGRCAPG